jgi:hypothetical protein
MMLCEEKVNAGSEGKRKMRVSSQMELLEQANGIAGKRNPASIAECGVCQR